MAKKTKQTVCSVKILPQLEGVLKELSASQKKIGKLAKQVEALRAELKAAKSCELSGIKKNKTKKKKAATKSKAKKSKSAKKNADLVTLMNSMTEAREGAADDLELIAGVGPKLAETLNKLGIFYYDQIADWTKKDVAWVDQHLNFPGRIVRENWIEQAKALAKGGVEEYVKVFGKEPR